MVIRGSDKVAYIADLSPWFGDSGGPIFDDFGQVSGVLSRINWPSGNAVFMPLANVPQLLR
jgi:hypothetical protein